MPRIPADEAVTQSGKKLQAEWLERGRFLSSELKKAVLNRPPMLWDDFAWAILSFAKGEPSALARYLRSDAPVDEQHRNIIADAITGAFNQPKVRGRPVDEALQRAAMASHVFLVAWHERNRALGIRDHGLGNFMRTEAVRFIVEDFEPSDPPLEIERVIDLMSRSKNRRKY